VTHEPYSPAPRKDSGEKGERAASNWTGLVLALLFYGLIARTVQYAYANSLWFDEARNALEILKPSWLEMLPPEVQQPTPIGFLALERLVVSVLGEGELALRLIPFLSGVGALLLGTYLARKTLRGVAVPLAVGFLALSGPAIYFSSELKQYSTDLLLFLVLATLFLQANQARRIGVSQLAWLAGIGAVGLWVSYTSVFILAVGGAWLFSTRLVKGDRRDALGLVAVGIAWLASFALHYELVISYWSAADWLNTHWQKSFPPAGGSAAQILAWSLDTVVASFRNPLGLGGPRLPAGSPESVFGRFTVWLAFGFFALGCIDAFRRSHPLLLLFLGTFALVIFSSWLQLYPLSGRLLLFLVPVLAFLTASGIESVLGQNRRVWFAVAAGGVLLAQPAAMATSVFFSEPLHGSGRVNMPGYESVRWVIPYMKPRWQPGDIIYLYHGAQPEYAYYARRLAFKPPFEEGVRAPGEPERYLEEIRALRGKPRVWVIFAHAAPKERDFFLRHLSRLGTRLDGVERPMADAHLYDLSQPPNRAN
jgi:hypothetical protein